MHCSPYLPVDYGPASYMPETVYEHFRSTKYYNRDLEHVSCYLFSLQYNLTGTAFFKQAQQTPKRTQIQRGVLKFLDIHSGEVSVKERLLPVFNE